MGFSWANFAVTQTKFLALIQMVEYTGTGGLGFWIILLNVGIYLLLTQERKKYTVIKIFILFIIPWISGYIQLNSMPPVSPENIRKVSIVQPNINPSAKWDSAFRSELYTIMDSLHFIAQKNNPDLILWPEVSLPVYLRHSVQRKKYEAIVKESGIPLLTGTLDWKKNEQGEKLYYNGSIFLGKVGNQIYRKLFLVPFAEYIPFSELIPQVKKLNIGQANFTRGSDYTVFQLDSIGFSNVICYESSIPGLVRKFINQGARFITIEANDAWSGNTSGVYQHFELAKLRAVEFRTAVARSGNTGISGIILPSGRVQTYMGYGRQGVITGKLPLIAEATVYARYGEIFSKFCLLITGLIIGLVWLKR
ncbi:MAG: apolipoprotein N-acyltransferase [Candidatus Neomarinimicrobiota bacterium]